MKSLVPLQVRSDFAVLMVICIGGDENDISEGD